MIEGPDLSGPQVIDFIFTSTYDGSAQPAVVQIPSSYQASQPTSLLVALHGWGDTRWTALGDYGAEANQAGWLLAAPDMHGEHNPYPRPPSEHPLASRASQQDVLDTIQWVQQRYNVDPSRIYLTGQSMGGQIALVTAAKNQGLFAAVVDDRGPTELAQWYEESPVWRKLLIEEEVGGPPDDGTYFEYQRRSPITFARNLGSTPLRIYHAQQDTVVFPHHSSDMLAAIQAEHPAAPVTLTTFPRRPRNAGAGRQRQQAAMAGRLHARPAARADRGDQRHLGHGLVGAAHAARRAGTLERAARRVGP